MRHVIAILIYVSALAAMDQAEKQKATLTAEASEASEASEKAQAQRFEEAPYRGNVGDFGGA